MVFYGLRASSLLLYFDSLQASSLSEVTRRSSPQQTGNQRVVKLLLPVALILSFVKPTRRKSHFQRQSSTMTIPTIFSSQAETKQRPSYDSDSDRDESVLLRPHAIGHNVSQRRRSRRRLLLTNLLTGLSTAILTCLFTIFSLGKTSNGECYDKFNAPCKSHSRPDSASLLRLLPSLSLSPQN